MTEPERRLAAEAGIAVLRVAFEQWVTERTERDLAHVMDEMLDRLRSVTAAPSSASTWAIRRQPVDGVGERLQLGVGCRGPAGR